MRTRMGALAALAVVAILIVTLVGAAVTAAATGGGTGEFVVLYAKGATAAQAHRAIRAAGGTIVDEIDQLGIARVTTDRAGFVRALRASAAIRGVARNHSVGADRAGQVHRFADERALADRATFKAAADSGQPDGVPNGPKHKNAGPDNLSWLQWNLRMIGATQAGAHATATGDGVLVGIIDTGIDASHPDLAPNFNAALSRNFTTDIPDIDGACETDPDQSCSDPSNVDEAGHGTHVAGIAAGAINGLGISGVAPDATLVNLRAGQDSGFFFFFETVAALTYAGDAGIDVVNMSFFTDPWLFNCASAADYVAGTPTAEEIAQQALIRSGVIAAVEYARNHGVTLVASAGNQHIDMSAPTRFDEISPDYPIGTEQDRTVTNNCLDLPSEAPGVIKVAAIGPSTVKADYSVWGLGSIDVAAPGGWFRDYFGTQDFREPENMILSSYPKAVIGEEGFLTKGGGLKDPHFYARDCDHGVCGYYTYLQGTSMASPHVTGVAALIIEAHGTPDGAGGYDLDPDTVYSILTGNAAETPCPDPALLDYTQEGRPASWTATCVGTPAFNSNYGFGIVDAAAAVAP